MTDLEWCRTAAPVLAPSNNTYSQYLDGMPGPNLHVIVIYDDLSPRFSVGTALIQAYGRTRIRLSCTTPHQSSQQGVQSVQAPACYTAVLTQAL
jgi:hypothetical protein